MKITTIDVFINTSRTGFLDALKHLNEIPKPKQGRFLDAVSCGLKQIDRLEEIVGSKPRVVIDDQIERVWKEMDSPGDYKLMVLRIEPTEIDGIKINGYLKTFYLPTTVPDVIEKVAKEYGGGKYKLRIVDDAGKYVKSKTFEISGYPKLSRAGALNNEESVCCGCLEKTWSQAKIHIPGECSNEGEWFCSKKCVDINDMRTSPVA